MQVVINIIITYLLTKVKYNITMISLFVNVSLMFLYI